MNQMKNERMLPKIALSVADNSTATQQAEADLTELADQLLAIAQELRRPDLARDPEANKAVKSIHLANSAAAFLPSGGATLTSLEQARSAYANRRARNAIFGKEELFGEPAWDILLDLYIAHVEEKPVSVSSACIGSASPPTTGLRWLGVLADSGLIVREHDAEDQRRVLVRLTDTGVASMEEYFARAGASA